MVNVRDIMRQARNSAHETLSLPSAYVPASGDAARKVQIRIWGRVEDQGIDLDNRGLATVTEELPTLIIPIDKVSQPMIGDIFSVEDGEAYRVEMPVRKRLGYHHVQAARMTAAKAAGLPLPEEIVEAESSSAIGDVT